jgi:hypothetical protein
MVLCSSKVQQRPCSRAEPPRELLARARVAAEGTSVQVSIVMALLVCRAEL